MSINVNVTGNPVSIRRGQMFMSDIESFKNKETQRRRKARLEQVRQQSKDLARDIRQSHKKHKSQLLCNYDAAQQAALKKWSAKRLLTLQQQYNDCLDGIGEAHRNAAAEMSPSRVIEQQRYQNNVKARERGKKAAHKLHEEKAKENAKKVPTRRKILNRQFEDVRSSIVSQLNKSKNGKRKKKCKKKKMEEEIKEYPQKKEKIVKEVPQLQKQEMYTSNGYPTDSPNIDLTTYRKSSDGSKFLHATCSCCPNCVPSYDTRLSELIKRRLHSEAAGQREQYKPADYVVSPPTEPRPTSNISPHLEQAHEEIPVHPAMDLTEDSTLQSNPPVEYYNHNNRFSRRYVPKEKLVERAKVVDCGVSCPTEEERKQWQKVARQRDLAAHRRGREALKRERIKRDHSNLLNELPNIQKGEQLLHTYTRKVDGHLSESRLKEKSDKRQREIEEAFEGIYQHHTPLITLEPLDNEVKSNVESRDLPGPDEDPSVNVAEWELCASKNESTPDNVDSLKNLLERVSAQRKLLKEEIANFQPVCRLPSESTSSTGTKSRKTKTTLIDIDVEELGSKQSHSDQIDLHIGDDNGLNVKINKLEPSRPCICSSKEPSASEKSMAPKKDTTSSRSRTTWRRTPSDDDSHMHDNVKDCICPSKEPSASEKSVMPKKDTTSSRITSRTIRRRTQSDDNSNIQDTNSKDSQTLANLSRENTISESTMRDNRMGGAGGQFKSQTGAVKISVKDANKESKSDVEKPKSRSTSGDLTPNTQIANIPGGIQIIIKVNDKSKPSSSDESKATKSSSKDKRTVTTRSISTSPVNLKWENNLSKSTIHVKETSTSTSYLSPPELFTVAEEIKQNKRFISAPSSKKTRDKSPVELNQKTKELIQKLLSMSRTSVDNLEVSSSEICTPDVNVVQTDENLIGNFSDEALVSGTFNGSSKYFSGSSSNQSDTIKDLSISPSLSSERITGRYVDLASFCSKRIDHLTDMIQKVRADTQKLYHFNPNSTEQTSYLNLPSADDNSGTSGSSKGSPKASDKQDTIPMKESNLKDLLRHDQVQSNVTERGNQLLSETQSGFMFREPLGRQQSNVHIDDSQELPNQMYSYDYQSDVITPDNPPTDNGYPSQSDSSSLFKPHKKAIIKPKADERKMSSSSTESPPFKNIVKPTRHRKPPPVCVQAAQKFNVDIEGIPAKELSTIIEDSSRNINDRQITHLAQDLQTVQLTESDNLKATKFNVVLNEPTPSCSKEGEQSEVEIVFQSDKLDVLSQETSQVSMNSYISPPYAHNYSQNTSSEAFVEVTSANEQHVSSSTNNGAMYLNEFKENLPGNLIYFNDNSPNHLSSSDSLDDALKQLGLGWAISTLRKTKQTLQLSSSSSSSSSAHDGVKYENVSLRHLLKKQHQKRVLVESTSSTVESIEISPEIRKLLDYIPSTSSLTKSIVAQLNKQNSRNANLLSLEAIEQILTKKNVLPDNLDVPHRTGRTSTPVFQKGKMLAGENILTETSLDISAIKKSMSETDINSQNFLRSETKLSSGSDINLTIPDISLDISKSIRNKSSHSSC